MGAWIAVLPFLGVPGIWKAYFTTATGVLLFLYAVSPIILKKLQSKSPRLRKRLTKAEGAVSESSELRFGNMPQETEQEIEVSSLDAEERK